MITQETLKKYAQVAVRIGTNVQPGQLLVMSAPVKAAEFARACMEQAYAAGAGEVQILWNDELCDRLRYEHEDTQVMARVPEWRVEMERLHVGRKCCFLHIEGRTPGLLAGVDSEKLQAVRVAKLKALKPFDYYTLANHGQWAVVAYPNEAWAEKVFPHLPQAQALEALWKAVLSCVRVEGCGDPVAGWARHNQMLRRNCQVLNDCQFASLHFENGRGTDLTVGLVENHLWAGGSAHAADIGVEFTPNLPTEEVFTMPMKYQVEGIVYATKPLDYRGVLAEDFWFRFEQGRVVEYGAKKGLEAIENLLSVDEGSRYLGEVALIPHDSPVSRQEILFLNTLFDENASCHLALGASFPENLQGGGEMTREQLDKAGSNDSIEHCDFMFGSPDMHITGKTKDGREIEVFREGCFYGGSGFVG